jgi:hypothetical protein
MRGPYGKRPRCHTRTPLTLQRPLQIIISIADQRISVYDDGALIARSSVSTELSTRKGALRLCAFGGRDRCAQPQTTTTASRRTHPRFVAPVVSSSTVRLARLRRRMRVRVVYRLAPSPLSQSRTNHLRWGCSKGSKPGAADLACMPPSRREERLSWLSPSFIGDPSVCSGRVGCKLMLMPWLILMIGRLRSAGR